MNNGSQKKVYVKEIVYCEDDKTAKAGIRVMLSDGSELTGIKAVQTDARVHGQVLAEIQLVIGG